MIKLAIDNTELTVPEGTSVMKAAESIGIIIPSMCFMEGYKNHPSCMVCLVKDKKNGMMFPSCAVRVTDGMDIISMDDEVRNARKAVLELLLSDHVGDCEAPCRMACPASLDIPRVNRLIAAGRLSDALKTVKEEIALPLILGYICEAPCEKVCRRRQIDASVSIRQIEKFVASGEVKDDQSLYPSKEKSTNRKVAIIGSGPAGLAAAFYLTRLGHHCVIFDKNEQPGGSLKDIPETVLPKKVLDTEIEIIRQYGVEFRMDQLITKELFENELKRDFDVIVIASGATDDFYFADIGLQYDNTGLAVEKGTFATGISGVFACGSVVRPQKMAVKAVAQGKSAAYAANLFLHGIPVEEAPWRFNSKFGKLKPSEYDEYLKESTTDNRVAPQKGDLEGFSIDEAILEAKRCMHCDCRKPDRCKLRIYADEYRADRKKYLSAERSTIRKLYNHDLIVYEPEKCIRCGLCIEITLKEKELTGLSFVGRGFDVRVKVPFNDSLKVALTRTAGKCAAACPTGAIALKVNDDR